MTTFPALIPSARTFTPGEYPATAFMGYSSAQNRVRHSNVFLSGQLRLSFQGLTEAQMLSIWTHYANRQGEFKSFALSAEVFSFDSITNYLPGTYLWRYAGPGQVEDLPCGGHNVSLTMETVPPLSASVIGTQLVVRMRLSAGAAIGDKSVDGIDQTITMQLAAGEASGFASGVAETITLSLTAGSASAS